MIIVLSQSSHLPYFYTHLASNLYCVERSGTLAKLHNLMTWYNIVQNKIIK